MIKTVVLVPLWDNEGREHEPACWAELELQLLQFGGFTLDGVVEGAWTAGDLVVCDKSRRYVVALPTWLALPQWLALVLWVRRRFNQEAVYIEVAGLPEIVRE